MEARAGPLRSFPGRLGIVQRVLPEYRVPFFDLLGGRCDGGLAIAAGSARGWETIPSGHELLSVARFEHLTNRHAGGLRHYACYQQGASAWLRRCRPDALVVEANPRILSNAALIKEMGRLRRPVLGWGLGVLPMFSLPMLNRARRRFLTGYLRRFDALLAYGSKAKEDFVALGYPADRVAVVHNSTSPPRVAGAKDQDADRAESDRRWRDAQGIGGAPIVLSVGRLLRAKRVDLLLRAFAGIEGGAQLIVVGDGPEKARLERLARSLSVRATFLGDLRGERLDAAFRSADVFVMPGLGGLALQEAMCWALPVIVTAADGSERDLVRHEDNGLVLPPADPSAMREGIARLTGSRELRNRMGSVSLAIARERSGPEKMCEAFIDILNAVTALGNGSPAPAKHDPGPSPRRSKAIHARCRVAVVCKNDLVDLPPAMTALACLRDLGCDVDLVASRVDDRTTADLASRGIRATSLRQAPRSEGPIWNRLAYWARFRARAWGAIGRLPDDARLWIASADSALALGPRLRERRFVLQINELYDGRPGFLRLLAPYARAAEAVVVPEATRAAILQCWLGTSKPPIVIPNKPHGHPRELRRSLDGLELPRQLFEAASARMVLCQGHIDLGRSLLPLAAAFRHLGPEFRLVLMGPDHGSLPELRRVCPDLVYVPPIPAPRHLDVSSHAHIGVVSYNRESLNHLFCAPNRIWEFAGFGIPILAQHLPGLVSTVERYRAGLCVEFEDPAVIAKGITDIAGDPASFGEGATALFESVDLPARFESIVRLLAAGDRPTIGERKASSIGSRVDS